MDDTDHQRDEINDEAVKGRDKIHFDSGPDNTERGIRVRLQIIGHLQKTQELPEDTHYKGGNADFLDPAGSLPGSEEQADERRVMVIMPAGPPERKRVNKSVKGNMAKQF